MRKFFLEHLRWTIITHIVGGDVWENDRIPMTKLEIKKRKEKLELSDEEL